MHRAIGILVVDDNAWIGESVERLTRRHDDLRWGGWVATTADLPRQVRDRDVDVVLLDLDIPGEDSLGALAALVVECPATKVLILSGYMGADLIDGAMSAGAWGYVSKNEEVGEVIAAVRKAAAGEVAMSVSVAAEFRRH